MFEYSDKVMDHFVNPRNVGELESPDGVGRIGNPSCGDIMEFQIAVEDDHITDVKFRTFGCGAAIAVSSMVSEMAKGRTLDDAMQITNKDVAAELDGLPKNKLHCSNLGADALHKAIENYRDPEAAAEIHEEAHDHHDHAADEDQECHCPHCDLLVSEESNTCSGCGAQLRFCDNCGYVVPRTAEKCPECGVKLVALAD